MKANKVQRKKPKAAITLGVLLFLVLAGIGFAAAYHKLREIWISPCVITDVTAQVTCNDGAMVKADTILDRFGVRNEANLANIDFDAKRREILRDIPNIRAITVTRHLPDRVSIQVEERHPVVRMGVHGQKGASGRVADAEGVVFTCRRGTGMLPIVREKATAITPVGRKLTARSLAALRLIETATDAEFAPLGVLDVDVQRPDYILMTLGNYAQAKIAWDGMDEPTESNQPNLTRQLGFLLNAFTSGVGSDAKVWNATIKNRAFADTQEKMP